MKEHSFNVDIASEYGLEEAILLKNIAFWCEKNEANKKHCYEYRYWTYNSVAAWKKLFPYMGEKKIRNALNNLIDKGLILKGNYNENRYDRTSWYALTDKAIGIYQGNKIHSPDKENPFAQKANGSDQKGEPIPYSNTDIKTDNTPLPPKGGESDVSFDDFWNAYDKKVDKYKCERKWKSIPLADKKKIMEYVPLYVEATPDSKYRKNPLTFLNGKCWGDNIPENKGKADPNLAYGLSLLKGTSQYIPHEITTIKRDKLTNDQIRYFENITKWINGFEEKEKYFLTLFYMAANITHTPPTTSAQMDIRDRIRLNEVIKADVTSIELKNVVCNLTDIANKYKVRLTHEMVLREENIKAFSKPRLIV